MKASDYIAKFFYSKGIEFNYIFTGGAIAHIIDSCWRLYEKSNTKLLKPVCVLHEQAGSMAMDAYSRVTGKPGLMMVTSGPGATNLLTGVACSFYDSIPGIYITGQVRTWELSSGSQRQLGFQETNIVDMAKPVTKYSKLIKDIKDLPHELEKAYKIATSGRPGPVLLDIPMDIQWANIKDFKLLKLKKNKKEKSVGKTINLKKIDEVVDLIHKSKKISILCGGGVRYSKSEKLFKKFAEKIQAPVFTTYGGKECFPNDHKLYSGMTGTMGYKPSNKNMGSSDLLLVIGSRLSWRQIRSTPKKFAEKAKIVHVDIDKAEINQKIKTKYGFNVDVQIFLKTIINKINSKKMSNSNIWASKCAKEYNNYKFYNKNDILPNKKVNPYFFFENLSKLMGPKDIIVPDAGQNVMWAMQAVKIKKKQRLVTSWGHSPMGYSFPAAIGLAAMEDHSRNIICTIGDGGMQLNIQELQTIKHYNLKVKIFIINNHSYGAIKDFNRDNLEGRMYATNKEFGYSHPDFCSVVKSYGFKFEKINKNEDIRFKIKKILDSNETIVCDVDLGSETFVELDPVKI